jgi:tetratricopeptide (TPR) repeat protein
MRIVPYGAEYGDLVPFLRSLAPSPPAPVAETAPQPAPVAPSPLPGRPLCLGRQSEVEILVAAFGAEPPQPAVVVGGAGMGKSTITLEALHDPRIRARFGARRFFVRCDGAKSRGSLAEEIARTLGLKPQGSISLESQICSWLESSPVLLVLDNAESPWEVPAETSRVEELFGILAGVSGLALAVSLRGEQFPAGVRWEKRIRVGPLSPQAAREVFQEIVGEDFVAEPEALDLLLRELGYWPLPVSLLAHQAQSEPNLDSLTRRWRNERTQVLARGGGQDKLTSLTASLEVSFGSPRLTEGARRLLGFLGILPDGISPEDLPALLPGEGEEAAARLRQVGLTLRSDSRLRALAPVREWLAAAHPPEAADFQRAVHHYVELARRGNRLGRQGGALVAVQLLAELRNLEAMVMSRLQQPSPEPGIRAACDLARFFRFTGWGTTQILSSALAAAVAQEDRGGEANCHWNFGELAFRRSQIETAQEHWERARLVFQKIEDRLGEADCLARLGDLAFRRSQNETAREHWEQARTLYRSIPYVLGEANCFRSLGDLEFYGDENEAAQNSWEQAHALYRECDSQHGEAHYLLRLGWLAFRRGQNDAAWAHCQDARRLYRQIGLQLGEADCLLQLGDIARQRAAGDSRTYYEEALTLYQQIQDSYSVAQAHRHLARIAVEPERSRHVQTARAIWEGQHLEHRVAEIDREFLSNG